MPLIIADLIYLAALLVMAIVVSTSQGRRLLGAIAAQVMGWGLQAIFYVAPTVAVQFARGLLGTFEQHRELWAQVVGTFVDEITGGTIDSEALSQAIAKGGLTAAAPSLGAPLIEAVRNAIAPPGAITADSARENLDRLLGLTVAFSLQGWFTAAAGDMVSLGKFGTASDLPDAIERGLGLSRLGRLAWRPYIKAAIEQPATVALNRQYRFTQLTMADAVKAWHRGYLDDSQVEEAALNTGHSPDNKALLINLATAEFAVAQVLKMVRFGQLTTDEGTALLRRQGWLPDAAAQLSALDAAENEQKLLDELASTARRLYAKGDLSDDELTAYLQQAHYTDTEVELARQSSTLAARDEKQLSVSELGDLVEAGHITPADYRDRLAKQHYEAGDIDLLLSLRTKKLSPAQVIEAVARGQLTTDAAQVKLEALGYGAEDALTLLNLRGKRLSEGQVLDAIRQGIITPEVGRADLEALGYADDVIDVLLAFERKQLSPADVQALLLRGELTEQDALTRLMQAGYSRDDAQAILELRVRLLTEGQILDAYGAAQLARGQAILDLEQRGLALAEAQTAVAIFDKKQAAAAAKRQAAQAAAFARSVTAAQKAGTPATGP